MSGSDDPSGLADTILHALAREPLDTHQLCADLAVTSPTIVDAELKALITAGLIYPMTVQSGRQAWGLTARGRWHTPHS